MAVIIDYENGNLTKFIFFVCVILQASPYSD